VVAARRGGGTGRIGVYLAVGGDESAVALDAGDVADTEVAAIPHHTYR
jgi:hypothetical protein